ncbi:MAG: hypothetical protein JSS82_12685 [Bacteroidetes bacterium]|nr:hypothetical protein [Bacteroidota bacterium]
MPFRKIFYTLLFVPCICMAQKDTCRNIERKVDEDKRTVTYETPFLKHLRVLKQTEEMAFFAIQVRLDTESPQFDADDLEVTFEDGTSYKDDKAKIVCQQDGAMISATGDIGGSFAASGRYHLQSFIYITPENLEQFSTRKISAIRLHEKSQKIQGKEAAQVLEYINCLKDKK